MESVLASLAQIMHIVMHMYVILYLVLYDCNVVASDCSSCVGTRDASSFQCGWCESSPSCSINELCPGSTPVITMGGQCPGPVITSVSPSQVEGSTRPELLLSLRPSPGNFMLITMEVSQLKIMTAIICFFLHPAGKQYRFCMSP